MTTGSDKPWWLPAALAAGAGVAFCGSAVISGQYLVASAGLLWFVVAGVWLYRGRKATAAQG